MEMLQTDAVTLGSDLETANELHAQIDVNYTAMKRQSHNTYRPSRFRNEFPRGASSINPKKQIRPRFSGGNSPDIEPAIDLYVRLVDHALPIFHALLHREPRVLPRNNRPETRIWEFQEPYTELSAEQINHTWTFLALIGRHLTWVYGHDGKNGFSRAVGGLTGIQYFRPLLNQGMLPDQALLGYGSKIATSPRMIRNIEKSAELEDVAAQKWHSLSLAVVWLHELSHAVINAVLPGTEWQEAYLDPAASTTELGFEIEARIFGGSLVRLTDSILAGEVVLREWPDCQLVRDYRDVGHGCNVRGSAVGLTREWKVWWKVSRFWVFLFEDTFWEKRLPLGALWPEKRVGVLRVIGDRALNQEEKNEVELEMQREKYTLGECNLVLKDVRGPGVKGSYGTDSEATVKLGDTEMEYRDMEFERKVEMVELAEMDETE